MAQNIISFGIDTGSFDDSKRKVLNDFITLFDKLSMYDGKTFSPVLGGGLLELNNSIKTTNTLLTEINSKMSELSKSTDTLSTASTKAASGTKLLTAEEAKLKVEIQEANKAILDQAKSENKSVQARENAKKSIQDKIDLEQKAAKAAADVAQKEKEAIDKLEKARVLANAENKRRNLEAKKLSEEEIANRKKVEDGVKKLEKEISSLNKQIESGKKETIKLAQEESAVTKKLISDYELLKQAQTDQANSYANLYIAKGGKNNNANADPSVKAAFREYQDTSKTLEDVEKQLGKASAGAGAFGRALGSGLNELRNIAYILPGIGLAGIFNLAYEAIAKAVTSLGSFSESIAEVSEREVKFNNIIKDQIAIFENLAKQRSEVVTLSGSNEYSNLKAQNDITNAQGTSRLQSLGNDAALAGEKYRDVRNSAPPGFDPATAPSEMSKLIKEETIIYEKLQKLKKISAKDDSMGISEKMGVITDIIFTTIGLQDVGRDQDYLKKTKESYLLLKNKQVDGVNYNGSQEDIDALVKETESDLELTKSSLDKKIMWMKEFTNSDIEMRVKTQEYAAGIAEAERKDFYEKQKAKTDKRIIENKRILELDISTEKERVNAIKAISSDEKKNLLDKKTFEKGDPLKSPYDKALIDYNYGNDLRKIQVQTEKDLLSVKTEFYQRRATATKDFNKSELMEEAIKNERISNNENISLEERLRALRKNIQQKQSIQSFELQRDLDDPKYKLKKLDPTVEKEKNTKVRESAEQQSNIQADIERKIYDIVYTSTQKQLNLVIDENKLEDQKHTEAYTKRLKQLNDEYSQKKISYSKYAIEKKEIDFTYQRESLDRQIVDDEKQLKRLQKFLTEQVIMREKAKDKVESAEVGLKYIKDSGDGNLLAAEANVSSAKGEYEGFDKSVQSTEKAVHVSDATLQADKLRRERLTQAQGDIAQRKIWAQAIRQIETALYNSIRTMVDREYEYKASKRRAEKALMDEQYGYEIAAVQKSSLSAKDKAALDIQLNAQKMQRDRNALQEEKKMRREKAEFDKKLSIAHIIMSTSAAVASLLATPPLALAAGIAGAAELVTVATIKIPAYAEGTGPMKHPGGYARTGEKGTEVVKEPYRSPYLVMHETISYLPKGTEVIPIKDSPVFGEAIEDHSWDQTRWLAKQMRKATGKVVNKNIINIDLGFGDYRKKILGN